MIPPNIGFDSSAEGVSEGRSAKNSFSSAITTSSRLVTNSAPAGGSRSSRGASLLVQSFSTSSSSAVEGNAFKLSEQVRLDSGSKSF